MLDRLVKNIGETNADYERNVEAALVNIVRYRLPLTAYRLRGGACRPRATTGSIYPPTSPPSFRPACSRRCRRRGIHLAGLSPSLRHFRRLCGR